MRVLLVITALIAIGQCAPQYGYEQPITSIGVTGGNGYSTLTATGTTNHNHQGGNKYLPPPSTTPAPIINKQFYVISSPEDNSNEGKTKHLVLGRPQKNYRVVFIKAPAPDNNGLKYSAEFAPQEEKTVIYVLSKKGDDIDAGNIATPAPTVPSKPEVFFIKYKTDEEAAQAQKEIQGQYDKIEGENQVHDETTAPVNSIVGLLDGLNPDGSYNYRQINKDETPQPQPQPQPLSPQTQYLPSFFRN